MAQRKTGESTSVQEGVRSSGTALSYLIRVASGAKVQRLEQTHSLSFSL